MTITAGPEGTVTTMQTSFSYTSSQRATFTCALDGAGALACGSGLSGSTSYSNLGVGSHVFVVTAAVTSSDIAQASRTWTIVGPLANQPPSASFTSSPDAPMPGEQVTFTSTSSDPDGRISKYEWDLDGDANFGGEGEPAGSNAVSASRSFANLGSYTVRLRVTDDMGAQAVASRAVTVVAPEPRRVPASFKADRMRGPYSLKGDALQRIAGLTRAHLPLGASPPEQDAELDDGRPLTACPQSVCAAAVSAGVGALFTQSPKPFTCCTGGTDYWIDPQIAASDSYLVIGMHHKVLFYDKAGNQLYTKAGLGSGEKRKPYTVQLCDLFKPLIPHMNEALHLPEQLKDVDGNALTVSNGYGLNCDGTTGGVKPPNWTAPAHKAKVANFYWPWDTIFDARVTWDEYRQRFWIVALAQNKNSLHRGEKGPAGSATNNTARSRRALLAIAVSKTGDPRDGWDEYWTWSYPGQDTCPQNACPYYGRGDFLRAGITSKYLVLQSNISDANKKGNAFDATKLPGLITGEDRAEIVVISLEKWMPKLGQVIPVEENDQKLTGWDGTPLNGSVWPAVQHAPDFDGGADVFFVSQYAPGNPPTSYNILLWFLWFGGAQPAMYQELVPVEPFQPVAPNNVPQKSAATTKIFGSGIYNALVYRNGSLYVSFSECGSWNQAGNCLQSVLRFVRIEVKGSYEVPPLNKAVDLRFTGPASTDPPGKDAWYGFPGVEANKDGDAVVAYQRSGSFVDPEVRYSAYHMNTGNMSSSKRLMPGTKSLGADAGDNHYMGMSVDPWDKTGIWIIHAFASDTGWGFVIGKALAPSHPDLTFSGAQAVLSRSGQGKSSRRTYSLKLRVYNQGDGSARASVARVYLASSRATASTSAKSRKWPDILVGSVRIRGVLRGRSRTVTAVVSVPAPARDYRYLKVSLDAGRKLREYGEQNNTLYLGLSGPTSKSR